MASDNAIPQLEDALLRAHDAGDTEAAQTIAAEIKQRQGVAAPAMDTSPIQKLNKWISDKMPQPVNEAVDVAAQPASGVVEGLSRMVMLPADIQKTVDGLAQGLDNKAVQAVVLSNPVLQILVGSSWVRQKLGAPQVTGSEELNKSMIDAGVTAPPAADGTGSVLRRTFEEIGANAIPAGGILRAASKAPEALSTGSSVLREMTAAARSDPGKFIRQDMIASAGGGLGAGIAKELDPGSSASEMLGLMTGTITPTAAVGTLRRLVRGGDGTRKVMEQTVKEFADAGVAPTVGMATRRRANEAVEAGLAILPGSSGRMAAYSERTARQLYDNVENVTAGLSPIRAPDAAGRGIKKGIEGYIQQFKAKWRTMDSEVATSLPPNAAVSVPETRLAIEKLVDPATSTAFPQLKPLADRLETLIKDGAMAHKDLRTFRSSVGGLIPESYAANLPEGLLKDLYRAMTVDLRSHLAAVDKASLRAFDRSNKYYTAGLKRLDESLAPLTSGDIPERVFFALERSGHAGPTVINAAKRSIGRENWDAVVGTIMQRMGMANSGAQGMAGDVFSVETFLTNWNKYARNRGTIEALLSGTSGGSQFAKDMTAVAKVAERFREAGRVFSNPSGTARAIANIGLGTSVASSALSTRWGTLTKILAIATGANQAAGAFTNPKFVHFLAQTTRVPPERVPGLVARLSSQMASEPETVQHGVAAILDTLSDMFSEEASAPKPGAKTR